MRANQMLIVLLIAAAVTVAVASASAFPRTRSLQAEPLTQSTPTPSRVSVPITGFVIEQARQVDEDDEPDVLAMALLTVGIAAAAGVLALIGYVIRKRIGFEPHRPPPREGGAPEEHH